MLKSAHDNYELVNAIGKGGYSMVYEAFNLSTFDKAVVKIINHQKITKINREVMVLKHISNKSSQMPRLIDYGSDPCNNTYYLIFDFFSSTTL